MRASCVLRACNGIMERLKKSVSSKKGVLRWAQNKDFAKVYANANWIGRWKRVSEG